MKNQNERYGIKKFKIIVTATVISPTLNNLKIITSITTSKIVAKKIDQRSKTGIAITRYSMENCF